MRINILTVYFQIRQPVEENDQNVMLMENRRTMSAIVETNVPLKSIILIGSQVFTFNTNRALVVTHTKLSASSNNSLK